MREYSEIKAEMNDQLAHANDLINKYASRDGNKSCKLNLTVSYGRYRHPYIRTNNYKTEKKSRRIHRFSEFYCKEWMDIESFVNAISIQSSSFAISYRNELLKCDCFILGLSQLTDVIILDDDGYNAGESLEELWTLAEEINTIRKEWRLKDNSFSTPLYKEAVEKVELLNKMKFHFIRRYNEYIIWK
jgi:hypothetical protein